MREGAREVLARLWARSYADGQRVKDECVASPDGETLGPALSVVSSSRGGPFPMMLFGPHWRLLANVETGKAKLVFGAEFLARVNGSDARCEAERVAHWLWSDGKWRVSRLDIACDVAGLDVERFANFDALVTQATTSAIHYDDEESMEGALDVVAARVRSNHRRVETVTLGSAASRTQLCAYDKAREALAHRKEWQLDAARERGWDGVERLTRVEVRLRSRALIEFPDHRLDALDALDRVDTWIGAVWRYGTRETRYVEPSETDSNRARWDVAPWWATIQAMADALPARRVRSVPASVKRERTRRASRGLLTSLVSLCAESSMDAHVAMQSLARIHDAGDENEAHAPELTLFVHVWRTHGPLISKNAHGADDVAARASWLRTKLEKRRALVAWTDDPGAAVPPAWDYPTWNDAHARWDAKSAPS
jgi:hypothetical protein